MGLSLSQTTGPFQHCLQSLISKNKQKGPCSQGAFHVCICVFYVCIYVGTCLFISVSLFKLYHIIWSLNFTWHSFNITLLKEKEKEKKENPVRPWWSYKIIFFHEENHLWVGLAGLFQWWHWFFSNLKESCLGQCLMLSRNRCKAVWFKDLLWFMSSATMSQCPALVLNCFAFIDGQCSVMFWCSPILT